MTLSATIRAVLLMVVGGAALFLSCCAPRHPEPVKVSEKAAQRDLFDEAEAYRLKGEIEKADKAYGEYLNSHPSGLKAAMALHRLADSADARGDERAALSFYRRAAGAEPGYEAMPEVRFQIARLLSLMGDYPASNSEAQAWLSLYPRHMRRGELLLLLADNAAASGSRRASFGYLLKAAEQFGEGAAEGAAVIKRIQDYLNAADANELRDLAAEAGQSPFAPVAYHRLTRILMDKEDLAGAEEALNRLAAFRGDPRWDRLAAELSTELEDRRGTRRNIVGCLLPLSGAFAQYGEEVLMGIQLALIRVIGQTCPMELVLVDTAGEEEGVKKALRDIVEKEKAIAAIGLFSSKEAQEAARTAQDLGLPILALTQKEGITKAGDRVFRFFPTASQEVQSLISWAVDVLGISRFALLHPDNAYGRLRSEVFRSAAEERGGIIAGTASYKENETDFESVIKQLAFPKQPRARHETGERGRGPEEEQAVIVQGDRPPPIGFEAVYIPDKADTVAMLAPQLLFHDVAPLALLGTSLWQNQRLIDAAGDYLGNAVIPSSYFEGADTPLVRRFNDDFNTSYGSSPGLLATLGFDSVRLLAKALCEGKLRTRKEAADAIRAVSDFETLRGPAHCDSEGQIVQASPLVTISGGRFTPVPAP